MIPILSATDMMILKGLNSCFKHSSPCRKWLTKFGGGGGGWVRDCTGSATGETVKCDPGMLVSVIH